MTNIELKMKFDSKKTDELIRAVKWMGRGGLTQFDRAIKIQAKKIVVELKKNLRKGGDPKFQKIAKFSHAVRLAYGLSGKKRGRRTGLLITKVKRNRVGQKEQMSWFAGVKKGESYRDRVNGQSRDAFDLASILENGRRGYTIELDKPSPRTGKTPRAWMTWLFLEGRIKSLPSKSTKYIHIKPAKPAKFVEQVYKRESHTVPLKVQMYWVWKLQRKFPSVKARSM